LSLVLCGGEVQYYIIKALCHYDPNAGGVYKKQREKRLRSQLPAGDGAEDTQLTLKQRKTCFPLG